MNTATILTPELDKISLPNWINTPKYTLLQQNEIADLLDNHILITAQRIKMPVCQMTTFHIQNCIKCFNGQGKTHIPSTYLGGRDKWLDIFTRELLRRQ